MFLNKLVLSDGVYYILWQTHRELNHFRKINFWQICTVVLVCKFRSQPFPVIFLLNKIGVILRMTRSQHPRVLLYIYLNFEGVCIKIRTGFCVIPLYETNFVTDSLAILKVCWDWAACFQQSICGMTNPIELSTLLWCHGLLSLNLVLICSARDPCTRSPLLLRMFCQPALDIIQNMVPTPNINQSWNASHRVDNPNIAIRYTRDWRFWQTDIFF